MTRQLLGLVADPTVTTMMSHSGETIGTIWSELDQPISEMHVPVSAIGQDFSEQSIADTDGFVELAHHLSSADPNEVLYQIPLPLRAVHIWSPESLWRLVLAPVPENATIYK